MVDSLDVRKRYAVSGKDLATLDFYVEEAYRSAHVTDLVVIRQVLEQLIDRASEVF